MKKSKVVKGSKKKMTKYTYSKKRNLLTNIRLFRWIKKSFSGKSHNESVDLLDQWILKKKAMTLFF
jgi:hypothetical protein